MEPFSQISKKLSSSFNCARGASAYVVFWGHIYQLIIYPLYSNPYLKKLIFTASGYAVYVFFILSGFMIGCSAYKNISDNNFNYFDSKSFFKNRLLRLYPPLIFSLLLIIFISFLFYIFNEGKYTGSNIEIRWVNLLGNIFFLQSFFEELMAPKLNKPLWSLSYEFWFYILFGLITSLYFNKRRGNLLIITVCLILIASSDRAPQFFVGVTAWSLGAVFLVTLQNNLLYRFRNWIRAACSISILLWPFFFIENGLINYTIALLLFCVIFISIAWLLVATEVEDLIKTDSILYSFFENSAKYSYSFYIIHWPLIITISWVISFFIKEPIYQCSVTVLICLVMVPFIAKNAARVIENKQLIHSAYQSIVRTLLKRS
jgi:peptidoglycan/LPS O-acetylase OafA/YrhL